MSPAWKLDSLRNPDWAARATSPVSGPRAELVSLAATALHPRCAGEPDAHVIWAPGRIEIAGKHTDYAGGRSLVTPTEQGVAMVVTPRSDRKLFVVDSARDRTFELSLDDELPESGAGWQAYFSTVARRLDENFPRLPRGADMSFASDLPVAAGLSSSSALVVGTFLALDRVTAVSRRVDFRQAIPDLEALAGYLGAVENGYSFGTLRGAGGVGTFGGSEDHTAILCGRPGRLVQYSYAPVRFERSVRLPDGLVFAIAASGIRAEKTGAAKEDYNRLSLLTQEVARIWRATTGRDLSDLGSILADDKEAATAFPGTGKGVADSTYRIDELRQRFEHFQQENEVLVPGAAAAMEAGDLEEFGDWIDRSMQLAESLLGNQVPETSFLAARARRLGALAASAFGAGFGGAVWALVWKSQAEEFMDHLKESYVQFFPQHREEARFLLTKAGPPAMEITPRS